MKAAPGARLAAQEIFGRDHLIAELWARLEGNSLRMEAERRVGKTSILHKMCAETPANWEAVFLDVERVHSADECAEAVCAAVDHRLAGWKKQGRRLRDLVARLTGAQLGPIKFPEKK